MKRADIAVMLVLAYTSIADDERAKLLLFPLVSGRTLHKPQPAAYQASLSKPRHPAWPDHVDQALCQRAGPDP